MQRIIMGSHNLRKNKRHNVQDYTQEFKKRALTLDIPLYMQENILKDTGELCWSI
jgi:hypothetical protein